MTGACRTPIALFAFNRPDTTLSVFDAVRKARPQQLFLVCDGPRIDTLEDRKNVGEVLSIVNDIDWPCEVYTDFSDTNMGCKQRVRSGLEWIFQHVEEAIILEDDCLPDPTFFTFCEQMLARFRHDLRVANISGANFLAHARQSNPSYFFSKYFLCWGWATWRRTWQRFDPDLRSWPEFVASNGLVSVSDSDQEFQYWRDIFERQYRGEIDSWAYSWLYSCWKDSGLTVIPSANLVSNIGFGVEATHTTSESRLAALPTTPLHDLQHPSFVIRDKLADMNTFTKVYEPERPGPLKKLERRLRPTLRRIRRLIPGARH